MDECMNRLAEVRKAGRGGRELADAFLEHELAVGVADVVGERRDRAPVQVEPARGIAARCQKEKSAPRRRTRSLLVDHHALASDRGDDDEGSGEFVAGFIRGERLLERHHPRRPHRARRGMTISPTCSVSPRSKVRTVTAVRIDSRSFWPRRPRTPFKWRSVLSAAPSRRRRSRNETTTSSSPAKRAGPATTRVASITAA
jgi:hypothetical protein